MEKLKRVLPYIFLIVSILGYAGLAYFFKRTDNVELFIVFFGLFLMFFGLLKTTIRIKRPFVFIFVIGLIFRLVFLFSSPRLSDDFFRFTWDGELSNDGISAFSFLPSDYAESFNSDTLLTQKYRALYEANTDHFPDGMNSKHYYSIYPTFNQFVFFISSALGSPNGGNLVIMRLFLILAEIISFWALYRLLIQYNLPRNGVFLYWLNPLVIIEIVGNLHFEGFAIAFMLLAFYYLEKGKSIPSVFALSLAIVSKLNPVFFLGAIFQDLKWKKFILYSIGTSILVFGFMSVILDLETFAHFWKSFGLYFAWFEFNTGIYAFLRDIGILISGVNFSDKLSLVFPFITLFFLFKISFTHKKIAAIERLLLLYFVYFAFTPIVHPWYILLLLPFGILSQRLFPLLWTFLIFFTYSAYKESGYSPDQWLVYLEYILVYICFYLEYKTEVLTPLKKRIFTT